MAQISKREAEAAERAEQADREADDGQVTLLDPDGQEFRTGDLATLNSLLMNGYRLKPGELTQADAVERLGAGETSPVAEAAADDVDTAKRETAPKSGK